MIDPKPYIDEAVADAKKRAFFSLISPGWIEDGDSEKADSLIRKEGPLSTAEMLSFKREYDQFKSLHFMDFFFELERLYAIINWLTRPEESRQWQERRQDV